MTARRQSARTPPPTFLFPRLYLSKSSASLETWQPWKRGFSPAQGRRTCPRFQGSPTIWPEAGPSWDAVFRRPAFPCQQRSEIFSVRCRRPRKAENFPPGSFRRLASPPIRIGWKAFPGTWLCVGVAGDFAFVLKDFDVPARPVRRGRPYLGIPPFRVNSDPKVFRSAVVRHPKVAGAFRPAAFAAWCHPYGKLEKHPHENAASLRIFVRRSGPRFQGSRRSGRGRSVEARRPRRSFSPCQQRPEMNSASCRFRAVRRGKLPARRLSLPCFTVPSDRLESTGA